MSEPFAGSVALADVVTAPDQPAMEAACMRAFAAGISEFQVDEARTTWIRQRRCRTCDHAGTYHYGDLCLIGPCGCPRFVPPLTVVPTEEGPAA